METVAAQDIRVLLIEMKNGRLLRLTVPKKAKITFGKVMPIDKSYTQEASELALRVYESQNVQLAAIPGVKQFRDLSLKLEEAHPTPDGIRWVVDNGENHFSRKAVRALKGKEGEWEE